MGLRFHTVGISILLEWYYICNFPKFGVNSSIENLIHISTRARDSPIFRIKRPTKEAYKRSVEYIMVQ